VNLVRLLAAILTLAGLDVAAAVAFKEAARQSNPLYAIYGVALFVGVGAVLTMTLELAELTIVSLGWIVMFQVVIMLIDHIRYDVTPGRVQLAAIVVALLALVVAGLAPASSRENKAGKHVRGRTGEVVRAIPAQRRPSLEEQLKERIREHPSVDVTQHQPVPQSPGWYRTRP
jgi:uncharacterized membrane protein YhaH (DUF805 family)